MNVLPTFLILVILTLIAHRHVHAYRIAKRRRGGKERTSNRQSTTDSTHHIPPCDPSSCCGPVYCLKCLIDQERLCSNQGLTQQARRKRGSLLPKSPWPFLPVSSETEQRTSSYGPKPPSHHDSGLATLTKEQQFIAKNYLGRYFKRRVGQPPLRPVMAHHSADRPVNIPEKLQDRVRTNAGPVILPESLNGRVRTNAGPVILQETLNGLVRTNAGPVILPESLNGRVRSNADPVILPKSLQGRIRTKRTSIDLCPSKKTLEPVAFEINGDNLVMTELHTDERWVLNEECKSEYATGFQNVKCEQRKRRIETMVNGRSLQNITVTCCVAVLSLSHG